MRLVADSGCLLCRVSLSARGVDGSQEIEILRVAHAEYAATPINRAAVRRMIGYEVREAAEDRSRQSGWR